MSPSQSRPKSGSRKAPAGKAPAGKRPAPGKRPTPRSRTAPQTAGRTKWIALAVAVAIAIAILVAVVSSSSNSKTSTTIDALVPKYGRRPAPASLVHAVTSVPESVYDAVATPQDLLPEKISGTTTGGRPEVLFIGAEFCPFCAADRWAIVNALSRFGTFTNLQVTHSSSTDIHANTETFSFYGSSYTSPYLTFTSVENATNQPQNGNYAPLQEPNQQQLQIWNRVMNGTPGYPFLYFAGRFASTSTFDPSVLANKTHEQIAAALSDAKNPITKSVIGTANGITAAICVLTNEQPASACSVPAITDLTRQLSS